MEGHFIEIRNRTEIKVSEVAAVDGFDETAIFIALREENLVICGKDLHITALNLEEGILTAEGKIESVSYEKKKIRRSLKDRLGR